MGPLGTQELVFIFVLALLLFGPKKLPELGKMVGKALTEFKRAQSELKATFDREMKSLERENESLKEVTNSYYQDSYNYDYSSYDSEAYGHESHDSTATNPSITGASAIQGAESTQAVLTAAEPVPEGAIAPEGTIPNAVNGNSAEQTTVKS
jgi:TatA/E family protein of Tat protein translocase